MPPSFGFPVSRYAVDGTGPLLIYIPGLDGTGQLFFRQLPELATRHRVVTFTLRESGQFTYDDLADDVAAIIEDLGEGRAIVVGESFGGTVALCFALRYGGMVDRLVIVNSFPRFPGRLRIGAAVFLTRLMPFSLAWPWRLVANSLGLRLDGVTSKDRRRAHQIMRSVARDGYVRRLELIRELDIRSRLHGIRSPAMFIAGDKDLLLPSAMEARFMASVVPNATVRIVKGAGHACLLGTRVSLLRLLQEWGEEISRRD